MANRIVSARRRGTRAQRGARREPGSLAPDREQPIARLPPLVPLTPPRRPDSARARAAIAVATTLLLHGAPLLLLLRHEPLTRPPLEVALVERQPGAPLLGARAAVLPPLPVEARAKPLPRLGRLPLQPTGAELERARLKPLAPLPLVADATTRRSQTPAPLLHRVPATGKAQPTTPEAKQPEQLKPTAKQPEPKQPEQLKPEPKQPEQPKPEQPKPEQPKPEPKQPEQSKPESNRPPPSPAVELPEPPPPVAKLPEFMPPQVIRPDPRVVIRDPDDAAEPPQQLRPAPVAPAAETAQLLERPTSQAALPKEEEPAKGLALDPLLGSLREGAPRPAAAPDLAPLRSGNDEGRGDAPTGLGELPGERGERGDGSPGHASAGGLVANDAAGVPIRAPVAAHAGGAGAGAGLGGKPGEAGAGGSAGGDGKAPARKGLADGAAEGRTEGPQGSGKAFEGEFEELDEVDEIQVRAWVRQLKRSIAGQWNTPEGVNPRAVRGKALRVEFVVRRDGRLLLVRVHSSSGDAELDEAVLTAFRKAELPEFPEQLPGASRGFRASFVY